MSDVDIERLSAPASRFELYVIGMELRAQMWRTRALAASAFSKNLEDYTKDAKAWAENDRELGEHLDALLKGDLGESLK